MESCKIIFSCNHEFNKVVSEAVTISVTKSSLSDTDVILSDGTISSIIAVYQLLTDSVKFFIRDIDFEISDYNSLVWIEGASAPADNSQYIVEYVISHRIAENYEIEDCPRCSGNGWYASLLIQNNAVLVSGINKTIQDFIKVIFTEKSSDTGYGSDFNNIIGSPFTSEEAVISEITSVINDCVTQIQNNQSSAITSGATLEDAERLVSVDVVDFEYDSVNNGLVVSLEFKNAANQTATLTFLT